jgi:pilus assembly protein CpaD
MSRISHMFALGLVGVAAAGCTAPPLNNDARHFYSAEQQFPIVVEPQVATLAVRVDEDLASLVRGEDQRIAAFAQRWKARGQGLLTVATPGNGSNDKALGELRKILASNGVAKDAVQYTSYPPASGDNQAPITLSFVAYAATAAECGQDWSQNLGYDPRNMPWPDFGCSSQHNLAALIADPHDLVEPHVPSPVDAGRRTTIMDKYQKGEPTGGQRAPGGADSGRSSQVGNN